MTETQGTRYQVLARKYRPETFADLVGQDAMVRTLKNAFAADRIAQAFIMTGIRGTGKTTTARIIAKGLNCIGPDGTGGPTVEPCGQCEQCIAIAEGRHVDVMEMDAASRTGVGDIREIIDSVHYRAASARYKIYIIDEVHMLSTSAFNALLKTLEEPPAHVKFIFATTEIRKVPVTVLSRCQRFDLRRIEPEEMMAMLRRIADAEGAEIAEDALALITRAAEGSARDAQSLLDQAISHGAGETTAEQVRAMLGLADRGRVLDLFDLVMKGDAAGALDELGRQYADGADPMAVLRDLAEVTHWVSVIKITPEAAEDPTVGPDERTRGQAMQEAVPVGVGAMAALLGLDFQAACKVAKAAAQGEVCQAANDNDPSQVVVSGHKAAVERAVDLAKEQGAKRAMLLPVSAPFHCALMAPAAEVMAEALSHVNIERPAVPVVANVRATAISDPTTIRSLLVEQVTGAVRWRDSVSWMRAHGADEIWEIGAGKALSGMIRRINKEIATRQIGTPDEVKAAAAALNA